MDVVPLPQWSVDSILPESVLSQLLPIPALFEPICKTDPYRTRDTRYHFHSNQIGLPVTGLVTTQLTIQPALPLATCLITPMHAWANPLWHSIHPHAHTDTLHSTLLANIQILLVSNAAVHPNGMGTCAWVIWARTKVWSGEGYAPGHLQDMYSGLAEAYGIYTVLSFFLQYTHYYPLIHCR